MIILGLNAYHGDSSACILIDGKLIAAVEEERFTRIKHWAGFPSEAIKYCLDEAKIKVEDIDHIAVNRNPTANLLKKALFTLSKHPSLNLIKDRLKNATKVKDIKSKLCEEFNIDRSKLKAKDFPFTFVVEPDQSNNLDAVSVSLVFQVRAIDKKRLKNKIGKIGQAGMDLLKRNLKEIMGLLDKEEQEKIEPSQ